MFMCFLGWVAWCALDVRFPLVLSGLVDVTCLMRKMLARMFIDLCVDL